MQVINIFYKDSQKTEVVQLNLKFTKTNVKTNYICVLRKLLCNVRMTLLPTTRNTYIAVCM